MPEVAVLENAGQAGGGVDEGGRANLRDVLVVPAPLLPLGPPPRLRDAQGDEDDNEDDENDAGDAAGNDVDHEVVLKHLEDGGGQGGVGQVPHHCGLLRSGTYENIVNGDNIQRKSVVHKIE